jgi:DNA polymerase-3 subunit gamma/tau
MQIMAGDAPGTAQENPASAGLPAPASPLALYRKYRPATFAEVKGQEHVTEPLRQALRNGRVHHAYLFSGPRGCGKTSSARILARSLNCEQGPTPDPCGVCASCVALAPTGPGSIDVIEIDAASHGGVDDARDLRERAFYAPVSGRFKIYIIDEAHMVTREGFNALLKLVEEPPPHLKFVFATTEPEKVIATIRSRTHHYPFRLVPPAVLRELLEQILAAEGVAYQPAVLPLVVRAGAGSARDALSILDQLLAGSGPEGLTYDRTVALLGYTDDSLLDEIVNAFATGDGAAVFGAVDRVVEGGHDPRRFAADLLDRLRDLIILAAVPGAGQSGLLDAPADRLERMAEQAGRFGQAELTRAAEIISEGLIQMRGATSPRLLLELMCAQVLLPAASTGEKALLARLERLEHQLAGVEVRPGEPSGETTPARPLPAQQATGQPAGGAGAPGEPARPRDGRERRPGSREDATGAPRSRDRTREDRATEGRPTEGRPTEGRPTEGRQTGGSSAEGRAADGGPAEGRETDSGPAEGRAAAGESAKGRETDSGPAEGRAADGGPKEGRKRGTGSPRGGASQGPSGSTAAPAGAGSDPGAVDADTLRQRWPEILDAVRSKGKVAWMLLNTASVQELENGVLTIAFPSGGNARGFSNSGHDQILAGALAAMLGLNVRVRAVPGGSPLPPGRGGAGGGQGTVGPQGTAGGQGTAGHGNPSGPSATDLPATGQSATDAPAQDRPASDATGQDRPASDATGQDRPASDATGQDRPASDATGQDRPASDATGQDPPASHGSAQGPSVSDGTGRRATASGRTASARPAPDSPASGPQATDRPSAGRAARGARASEPAGSAPAARGGPPAGSSRTGQAQSARSRHATPPQPATFADDEWPDDATGPGAADSLSGMELIQRQLGGRVIEEIEDT